MKNMSNDESIPVLVYHNIDRPDRQCTAAMDQFNYGRLSEHHFRKPSMADIAYNNTGNALYIKRS
jgi:hypothetical protein